VRRGGGAVRRRQRVGFFSEKLFAECFLGTRQRLCRVRDKKHTAN